MKALAKGSGERLCWDTYSQQRTLKSWIVDFVPRQLTAAETEDPAA